MPLPDLSNSMLIAKLRHIQTLHETAERRNPDVLVSEFIPPRDQKKHARMTAQELAKLRSNPFYYYLVSRTRHYDTVVTEAVDAGIKLIVGVGTGSDTRAYRFKDQLRRHQVRVIESDLRESILTKREIALRWQCSDFVDYMPIDLNNGAWPRFQAVLEGYAGTRTLVFMEGVSPYISHRSFTRFLSLLTTSLAPGSQVAYDFKFRGANDAWGREGWVHTPFRLPRDAREVEAFHTDLGLRVESLQFSADLSLDGPTPGFAEDGLVRLVTNRP